MREEFRAIIGLWLQQGVSGFRIDAAPFLIDLTGTGHEMNMETAHAFLRELRDFSIVRQGNAVLLGEVDVGLSTIADYFGGGNELQALFSFPLNRFTLLGLAQKNADAIKFGLGQLPTIPDAGQWVNFLRHHDELNLSQLTKEQRSEILDSFAPKPGMRIYDRGLRRRLAPMFGGDQARLRMAYSLLFGLPGAPLIYYGEEIGMGENLRIPGRNSVRTPMQWTARNQGGFSTAAPRDFVRPMPGGEYGPDIVNVGAQRSDPDALLNFMATLIRTRRECAEIGTGTSTALDLGTDHVLGLRYDSNDSAVIVLNNLSDQARGVTVALTHRECRAITELLRDRPYPPFVETAGAMTIGSYGYRWFRIGGIY